MYNVETVKKGFDFLGISIIEEREIVIDCLLENNIQNEIFEAAKRAREAFENRFIVPVGLGKKELQVLEKETKAKISELKIHARTCLNCWIDGELPAYVEKAEKLKTAISSYGRGKADVTGAKRFPIDQMIEFKNGGFAKCLFHDEKSASMKYYPKTNTVYCFPCAKKWDAIDIYMQLYGITFGEAVKKLTCT